LCVQATAAAACTTTSSASGTPPPLVEASTLALRYATDTLKYITSYILYQTMVIEIWRIAQTNIKHRFREKYRPKVKYIDIHMHV
jgi:hypothetical protein